MKNNRPRVALIGYGYWGPNLLRNLVSNGQCDVVGVVEPKEDSRQRIGKVYPQIQTYSTVDELLNRCVPDAAVIATPPSTHCDLAIRMLDAGAHILVEKPLAMSVEECDQILDAARKADRQVMVDHTFAFNPAVEYLAEQVQKGNFGDLLYYDSVRVNLGGFQSRTNALWDLAPHDLSIIDLLVKGKMPVSVSAVGVKHFDTDVENLCYVHLSYSDSFVAHLQLNWAAPIKIRTVLVGGTKKMAVYDENLPTERVKVYDRGVDVARKSTEQDFRVSYRMGDMIAPAIPNQEALSKMIAHFISHTVMGKPALSDGQAGRRIVQILEAASVSMSLKGAPISVQDTSYKLRAVA